MKKRPLRVRSSQGPFSLEQTLHTQTNIKDDDLISFPAATTPPLRFDLRQVTHCQAAIFDSTGDLTMDLWTTRQRQYGATQWSGQIKFGADNMGASKGLTAYYDGTTLILSDGVNFLQAAPFSVLLSDGTPIKANMRHMTRFSFPDTSWSTGKAVFLP